MFRMLQCRSVNRYFLPSVIESQIIPVVGSFSICSRNYDAKFRDQNRSIQGSEFRNNLFQNLQLSRFKSSVSAEELVSKLPAEVQPYAKLLRADKPTGTWLVFWPGAWSIAMSADGACLPDAKLLGLFLAGAFLMRGAGCVINDIIDRDIDSKVERTKIRPLASGQLNMYDATACLAASLSLSLAILLQLNWFSIVLGASSVALVAVYPLMKRVTYYPQVVLGMTFNWGALLGSTAVYGYLCPSCLTTYLSALSWTLIYDTIYAHQDKLDDISIGMKSTAIKFGDDTQKWLLCFSSAMIGGLTVTGLTVGQTWPYYASIGFVSYKLIEQVVKLNISDPEACSKAFGEHAKFGLYIFIGIVLGKLLMDEDIEKTFAEYKFTPPQHHEKR